jgi:hypothetical protein
MQRFLYPLLPGEQAKVEELLLDWTAVQAAVNDNSAIGQDALVKQVTVDGSGGDDGTPTSVVSLSDFSIIVTSDGTDTVDEEQLSKTLEDYLAWYDGENIPAALSSLWMVVKPR